MSFENTQPITLTAGAAVAANRFVLVGTNAQAIHSTAGADADGVSAEAAAAAGDAFHVYQMTGKVEVQLGGTVALGARVASDGTGQAIAATGAVGSLGVALQAGADGDIVTVLLSKKAANFA